YALALFHYWGHRDYAAAVEQLDLAAQSLPNSADVAMLRASITRRQGRTGEMIAGFRQAVLLDPRSAFAVDQLALAYEALRHYEEADRAFAQAEAITRDPVDERVTRALNTVAWSGDLAPLRAALAALTPGSDPYSGNTSSFYALHWWGHEPAKAAEIARADVTESWTDQQNILLPRQLYLAWALQAANDKTGAEAAYKAVEKAATEELAQQPDRAELHLALAFANAGLGRVDAAHAEGRKAAELLPPSRDALTGATMQVYYAQVLARVGDIDGAFGVLQPTPSLLSGVSISSALLKLDPVWQPLRNHPRFAALAAALDQPIEIRTAP
ncbi:MAG TPA: hypothetical protein VLB69_12940, partial [Rudaea sp.]|nr:hypothetical protein [Rudaea sp.]